MATRMESKCELGRVFTSEHGRESVEFVDLKGSPCRLSQIPGSTSIALQYSDNYRVFARNQIESLVAVLGRLLESGSMVDMGDEL